MTHHLTGKKIAILVANGFEQSEMTEPKSALEEAGATVQIISPEEGKVKGWQHDQWGDEFHIDLSLSNAKASDFNALLLPGGVMNPDKLRLNKMAIDFISEFITSGKPIAAICHGPWTLINANGVDGVKMTSWPSIKLDLINAGADWVDMSVVRDGKLVTSRKPDDIPDFNREMIAMFAE